MPAKKKRKIVIGNWKMNVVDAATAKSVMKSVKNVGAKLKNTLTVVCPPYPYISLLKASPKVKLGAQDVFYEEKGSFTGNVSVPMLASLAVDYVIVGHSERRKAGETDEVVALKTAAVLKTEELKVVVCIGETTRDAGGDYLGFLRDQIRASLSKVQKKQLEDIIVAYEPVWAIGASEPMNARDVHETTLYIKKILSDMYGQEEALKIPILYGGAVFAKNAREIVSEGEVDGILVGRESVNPPGFAELLKAVDSI